MKKLLTSLLVLCICIRSTQSVFAEDGELEECVKNETYILNEVAYTCTVHRYKANTSDEYKIVIIQSDGYYLQLDTRNDYFIENGEVVHYSISISKEMQNDRSHPTAIQHGLTLKPNYHYSYSTWTTIETDKKIVSMTANAIVSLLIAYIPGMGALSQTVLSGVAQYLINKAININYPDYDFDVRIYMYANIYVLSQFGQVRQNYLGNTPVMQGVVADLGMEQ